MMLDRRQVHDDGAFWYTSLGFLALMACYYFIWDRALTRTRTS